MTKKGGKVSNDGQMKRINPHD